MTALIVVVATVGAFMAVASRIRDSRARWLGRPGFPGDARNKQS